MLSGVRVNRTASGEAAGRAGTGARAAEAATGYSGAMAAGRRGWRTRRPGPEAATSMRLSGRGAKVSGEARSSKTSAGQDWSDPRWPFTQAPPSAQERGGSCVRLSW
ncbi:hypothetical protein AOPFMNJM_1448 [Methylobacterium jeotgali]|uniref:Uncharacterized protein n=1 Tax=Methylobacterium jeotgali TaxID=381630 RepID=A0ABQ4SWT3_9HYPH|nr:hypothetical protein AOPFMNJM_1448 [Methylobacterium jeotgali]